MSRPTPFRDGVRPQHAYFETGSDSETAAISSSPRTKSVALRYCLGHPHIETSSSHIIGPFFNAVGEELWQVVVRKLTEAAESKPIITGG